MTETPTLERARKIFALLAEAGSLPASEREELFASCEPSLADEVRSLLEADAISAGGLTTGPLDERFDLEALFSEDRLPTGTALGPYRVLDLLGAGGMGQVYLAQQEEPIRRKVALKTLHGNWRASTHAGDSSPSVTPWVGSAIPMSARS
ncbi:MAG: hypothetical protein AAFX50_14695 [Acidobacteriota bacterium]